RGNVPDVSPAARRRVCRGAGRPGPPDAGDRGGREVLPAAARAAEPAARDALLVESRRASERAGELRAQLEERERAVAQRRGLEMRARVLDGLIRARPTGYDRQRHDVVRAELTKLEPVALEAAKLAERAKRAEILVREAELAEQALSLHEHRARELAAAVAAEQFSE